MAESADVRRRQLLTMLTVVSLTAAVVYGIVASTIGRPVIIRDAFAYNASALRLLHTGVYEYNPDVTSDTNTTNGPSAFTMPGYTAFLAGVHALVPDAGDKVSDTLAAQVPIIVIQLLLAAATAGVIAYSAYLVGGLALGWTAGGFAVAYVPFGMNATVTLTETPALFLMSVVVLATVELLRSRTSSPRHDIAWAVTMGLAAGLSALVRPAIVLWLTVPLIVWVWVRRDTSKRAAIVTAVAVGCFLAAMLPWVVRNAIAFDSFIPLTSSMSTPLLDSVGGATFTEAEEELISQAEAKGEDPYRAVALERLAARWAVSPGGFVRWKAQTLWTGAGNFTNLPADILVDIQTSGLPPAGAFADAGEFLPVKSDRYYTVLFNAMTFYHRLLLLLAVIGVVLGRRRAIIWTLASIPIYYAAVHTVILFMVRYFYPAMPAIIILAAFGAVGLWRLVAPVFNPGVKPSESVPAHTD